MSVIPLFRFLCIAALLLVLAHTSFGQSSHQIFDHLTTEHGLSSDKVSSVIQDNEGFYWIATQNGLNRFDGTTFKIFRNDPQDSTTITHNSCSALLEDLNGDIWVATYAGISRFRKTTGTFQQIYLHHPSQIFSITNRINNLTLDHEGNIWISSFGLWKYDIKKDSLILFQKNNLNPGSIYENNYISKPTFDNARKGIWFVSSNAVQYYDIKKDQFYHALHNPLNWQIFNRSDGGEIALDRTGKVWFLDKNNLELLIFDIEKNTIAHTGKTLYYGLRRLSVDDQNRLWILYWLASTEIFDPAAGTTGTHFFSIRHPKSILSDKVVDLFIDTENNYWISSANGISIYNPQNQFYKLFPVTIDSKGYENDLFGIKAIAQTDSHSLWLATNIGLYKFNLQNESYQKITTSPELGRISALCAEKEILWIAHERFVYQFHTRSGKIEKTYPVTNNIFYIKKGNGDDLWVGIWRGGVYRIDLLTGMLTHFTADTSVEEALLTNSTISAFADKKDLWIGYNLGKGFSQLNTETNVLEHFNPSDQFPSHFNAGVITFIEKDRTGSFWLGTHGSGVLKWNPATGKYKSYTQSDGLRSNFINCIVSDRLDNVWISTTDGINFLDINKSTVQTPDISFVFPISDHVANGIKGVDGYIYFFRPNDIIQINSALYQPDTLFPNVVLSSFKIFDEEHSLHGKNPLPLSYNQNFFSFEFSAIKATPGKVYSYAYKLEGFDRDWHHTSSNTASYTNVPGGRYTFRVKVNDAQGQWSEVLMNIPLTITPPLWRTWWFITLSAILILCTFYVFHRYRLAQVKKILSMRTKISQDLHDDIGGSLSSIYIYSSVAEKEVMDNPVKAKEFLKQINTNSLQVMDNISDIVWANNQTSLGDSTLGVRIKNFGYELLSQKNIECVYAIDPHVESKLTSPEARRNILLIIKEALNNMAKYSEATEATVTITQFASGLLLSVEDNGQGFDMDTRKPGHGITTMQQRALTLEGQLTIKTSPGKGTKINCLVPLAKISD